MSLSRSLVWCVLLACLFATAASASSRSRSPSRRSSVHYTPAALADQIHNLPGLNTQPSFNQFAGYLNVDPVNNRNIFYWFVESTNNPVSDPVFWWSNGGPGCSGLLGFLTEHGPFRTAPSPVPGRDNGLEPFPFSWNSAASVLYVEAPAGVGFSFSDNEEDYTTGDFRTAMDNYLAIQAFFAKFPHLRTNELYLSSESYGGHYIPTLSQRILIENADPSSSFPQLNFKGFLVGNPFTDPLENSVYGQITTMCGHALASYPTCQSFKKACIWSHIQRPDLDPTCQAAMSQVMSEVSVIDPYGLDFPGCDSSPDPLSRSKKSRRAEKQRFIDFIHGDRAEQFYPPALKQRLADQMSNLTDDSIRPLGVVPDPYDPCEMAEEDFYLNRADVRAALHVSPKVGQWVSCSQILNYNQTDGQTPMEPVWQDIVQRAPQLKMVVMSGDDDSVCATTGTEYWMYNTFGTNLIKPWLPWSYTSVDYSVQVGGFFTQFSNGVSLVSVHGAGHMISSFKPQRGLAVFLMYINDTWTGSQQERMQLVDKRHKIVL